MNLSRSVFGIGIVLILFTLLYSCGNSKNVYYFYEDGSGKTETTVDLGAMISQGRHIISTGESKALIEKDDDEFDSNDLYEYDNFEEEEEEIITQEVNDSNSVKIDFFEMMFAGFTDKSKFDTTFVLKDMLPAVVLEQLDRPGLLEKLIITANVDEEKEIMIFNIEQKFSGISEIRETQNQLDKVSALMGKKESRPTQFANPDITYDTKERFLYVPANSVSNFDFFGTAVYDELISVEQIDKMIEMTGVDKITTIYYLPYPIISVETESEYILSEDRKSLEVHTDVKNLIKNGYAGSLRVRY